MHLSIFELGPSKSIVLCFHYNNEHAQPSSYPYLILYKSIDIYV